MKPSIHPENRTSLGLKLVSPSSVRNCGPIGDELAKILPDHAAVLEIASGTGQHAHHMCGLRPDLTWQPTDIDAKSRASQAVYRLEYPRQMAPPHELDVTTANWWETYTDIDAIFCANMIHIAPWTAAEGLAKGAGQLISKRGLMCLYGPFLTGTKSAESNISFDQNLKKRNTEWGVRVLQSVKHIFAGAGLELRSNIGMPRDNLLLVFTPTN